MTKLITKSIRVNEEESKQLKQMSQEEGVSEAMLLKRFVHAGMATYRLERAIAAYERGEADIGAAARYAGISIYHLMTELQERNVATPAETEKFVDGLKTLIETFGGSEALRLTLQEL